MNPRELLRPRLFVPSVHDLDLPSLRRQGIRGLILDLDNTLVAWGSHEVGEELFRWVREARGLGMSLCFSSNARSARVAQLASQLGIPGIPNAAKPRRRSFRQALLIMGTSPQETAVVGDQLFTDVLGGNRLGLYTILVQPLDRREFFFTRLVRRLERLVLRALGLEALGAGQPGARD